MKIIGVYKIVNIINNKVYIGSSVDIKSRWRGHKSGLNNNKHHSTKLQNSYNKYGVDNFVYIILETLDNKDNIIQIEQHYIDMYDSYNNGFNCRPIAESPLYNPVSSETRSKISKTLMGHISPKRGIKLSQEIKDNISKGKKGCISNRKGSKHTDESKEKMSKLRKGIKWNPNYIKVSDETKNKISQTMIQNGTGGRPRKCKIDDIEYNSAKEASIKLNIKYKIVLYRIESKKYDKWNFNK